MIRFGAVTESRIADRSRKRLAFQEWWLSGNGTVLVRPIVFGGCQVMRAGTGKKVQWIEIGCNLRRNVLVK